MKNSSRLVTKIARELHLLEAGAASRPSVSCSTRSLKSSHERLAVDKQRLAVDVA